MKTDFVARVPVNVPSVVYPHQENSVVVFYVCNKVGSSVRIHATYDDYCTALDKAADMSIEFHRNYFVVMVESKIRVL